MILGSIVTSLLLGARAIAAPSSPFPANGAALVQFGVSIAVAGDELFVGDPSQGDSGGIVHIYRRSAAGGWRESGTLPSPNTTPADGFGIVLAADLNTVLVTRYADSTRGGVLIFRKQKSGAWAAAGILGPERPAPYGRFGSSLVLAGDEAFVGAIGEAPGGAVHVYHRGADGSWQDEGKLAPAGPPLTPGDQFGAAITVVGDRAFVGAPGRNQKGAVYPFHRGGDGHWAADGAISARDTTLNSLFGFAVASHGDELYVGAPGVNTATGAVTVFARGTDGQWAERTTLAPYEKGLNRFGQALTIVGDELWISAPYNNKASGAIFRMQRQGVVWSGMTRLAIDSLSGRALFGFAVGVGDGFVAVGMPQDNEGTVALLTRSPSGSWALHDELFVPRHEFAAVTAKEVVCNGGKAADFECGNTGLLSFLPISQIGGGRGVDLSGMWGWTDPLTGRDYALIGRTDAAAFVDVTDPLHPRYLGDLPRTAGANASVWREIKTYKNYALIVSDGSGDHHGIQIFDLTHLRNVRTPQHFTEDAHYDRVGSVHDIVVDQETGFAYAVGTSSGLETCGGGLHMIDIHDPLHPQFAGCFTDRETGRGKTGYTHDAQCVKYHGPDTRYTGHEICIAANETHVSIQDVTDKKDVKVLAHASYPSVGYTHQGWFTDDQRYWFLDDELDETSHLGKAADGTRTIVWDMKALDDPIVVKEYIGTTKATDHNQYVKGNRLYQSDYMAGLRILDITDPVNPHEVGFFDTHPGENVPGFEGSWSNYPFFKNGAIGVVSIGEGFFLVRDRTSVVP